ncbi:MAG: hypothetical protein JRN06_06275 [Nitrososphaerota archaeon]|nr:hypothetical protein [Nitrososphaerota archaeon]
MTLKFRKPPPTEESVQRLLGSARLSDATKKGYLGRVQRYLREAQMTPDELVAAASSV